MSYKQEYLDYLKARESSLEIVKTTKTPCGKIIDWIPIESQGEVCLPPPPLKQHEPHCERPEKTPLSELQLPGIELGPEGTVPVLRPVFTEENYKIPLQRSIFKRGPPLESPRDQATGGEISNVAAVRDMPGLEDATADFDNTTHWYVYTADSVKTYGGQGQFSCFSPSVDKANDFSLLEIGIIRQQGAARDGITLSRN
jgi:hypothetical protein